MDVSIYASQYTHYNCLVQYAAQGVKRLVVSVSQSVSLSVSQSVSLSVSQSVSHAKEIGIDTF